MDLSRSLLHAVLFDRCEGVESKAPVRATNERWIELGHAAAHLAHEMHGGLVPIALYLSLLRRRLSTDPSSAGIVDKIEADVLSLCATIQNVSSFISEREPAPLTVNVREVVDEVLEMLAPRIESQAVDATTDVPADMLVWADRAMLHAAVLNLAVNALEAMPQGGRLVVTAYIGRNGLELEVADSGPGLSDKVRGHVFEPFFTTKSRASGLGLAVVRRIALAHGGDCSATNCPEGGAAFTLRVPQRPRARRAA